MNSIQPLIKALMQEETHTPSTTAHTDLRQKHWGPNGFSIQRHKLSDQQ